jgi:hypothetical protein
MSPKVFEERGFIFWFHSYDAHHEDRSRTPGSAQGRPGNWPSYRDAVCPATDRTLLRVVRYIRKAIRLSSTLGIAALSLATLALLLPVSASGRDSGLRHSFKPAYTPGNTTTYSAYLQLSIDPPIATTNSVVTLHIAYHNIGFVYTDIAISSTGLITFEPPLTMPCKYDQPPYGCTAITLRTLAPGVATFRAVADGEVYDESCHCWYWSFAADNGPVSVIIADVIWRMLLPVVQR